MLAAPGEPNLLAVRVANYGSTSRWYSGSGLIRPVSIRMYPALHLVPSHRGGVYIRTQNTKLSFGGMVASTEVNVSVSVQNDATAAPAPPTRLRLLVCDNATVIGDGWKPMPSMGTPSSFNSFM